MKDYSFVNIDGDVLWHFQWSNFHEWMHLYHFLLAGEENIDAKDCCSMKTMIEPLRAFYDQNEFVPYNEMVVLVDTEEEPVVDSNHLNNKKIITRY